MERLSKNLIWMAGANIVSSLVGAGLLIYLARTLLPEAFGYLSYAFTLVFFLANFIDLGLSTFGVREIAKDTPRVSDYASEIVSLRLIIACVLAVLFILSISLASSLNSQSRVLMVESALIFFIFALATEWAFQGLEKMHMVFISLAVTALLQLILALLFMKGPQDAWKVPLIYFISAMPVAVVFLRRLKFRLLIKADEVNKIGGYLSSSIVIWAISLFAQVYNSLDVFILGMFRRMDEVGYYTIARRAVGAAAILAIFLANALLPRLSLAFGSDIGQFKDATRRFLTLSACLTFFVFLPAIFFVDKIILVTVGTDYLPVAAPLKIMILGLVLIVFNIPYSTGLLAGGMEKEILKQACACAALSLILNFLLIPGHGMIGAAITFVVVESLALTWILCVYRKKISLKLF